MNGKDRMFANEREAASEGLVSHFPDNGNSGEPPQCSSADLDQKYPQPNERLANFTVRRESLGEPLAIEQVAELLGCSAWTVRQRYLRQGLPHLQARPRGKLVFFREQVIAWTLKRQRQKGGILR